MNPSGIFDRSGSITEGGTAQTIATANGSRRFLLIQNVSDTTMWVDFDTTAVASQPSIRLLTGEKLEFVHGFVPSGAISAIGASTGKTFVCKEG